MPCERDRRHRITEHIDKDPGRIDSARCLQPQPLFRSVSRHGQVAHRGLHKDSVGAILKTAAERAGMKTKTFAVHTLRAGCVTQAAMNGVTERDIIREMGHKSSIMLAKYIRIGQIFTHNAAAGLGI